MQEPSLIPAPKSFFSLSVITGLASMAVLGLMLVCPPLAEAQTPQFVWTRQFGSASADEATGVSADASGIYVAGFTFGALPGQTNVGQTDVFVRKYDGSGNELWTRQFGTAQRDESAGVFADASGVYIVGFVGLALEARQMGDAFVRKYDANGNEVWTRQFGTADRDQASGVSADASGIYVTGWTLGTLPGQISSGMQDAFIRKYDTDGNELWTRQFGTGDATAALGVSVDASGIYVRGNTFGTLPGQISAGDLDVFVRKYDASGNEVWTRQFGSANREGAHGSSADVSGIYVTGWTQGTLPGQISAGEEDVFVRKYDVSGNEVWTLQFGTAAADLADAVFADASGIYVVGRTTSTLPGQIGAGGGDAFVRKYDANGNEVWTLQFGSAVFDFAAGVSGDASGIYVTGQTSGTLPGQTNVGQTDVFLAKLAASSPAQQIQDLVALVEALNLKKGIAKSLQRRLDAALNDLQEGDNAATIDHLQSFIHAVETKRGVHISDADADALIAAAQAIIAQLTV